MPYSTMGVLKNEVVEGNPFTTAQIQDSFCANLNRQSQVWVREWGNKTLQNPVNQMNGLAHHKTEPSTLPSAEPSILCTANLLPEPWGWRGPHSASLTQGYQED